MKSKRIIFSLREDEISLLLVILKEYMSSPGGSDIALSPGLAQAQKMFLNSIQKLINKLEKNNER